MGAKDHTEPNRLGALPDRARRGEIIGVSVPQHAHAVVDGPGSWRVGRVILFVAHDVTPGDGGAGEEGSVVFKPVSLEVRTSEA